MTQFPHYAQKYRAKDNRLYKTMAGKNGTFERLPCNFVPRITAEITPDGGAEKKTVYAVTGWKEVMEEQRMTSLALLHKCKQQSFQKFFALISWTACGFAVLLCKVFFQVNMGHHFIESIYRIIYFNNSFQIHW